MPDFLVIIDGIPISYFRTYFKHYLVHDLLPKGLKLTPMKYGFYDGCMLVNFGIIKRVKQIYFVTYHEQFRKLILLRHDLLCTSILSINELAQAKGLVRQLHTKFA